MCVKKYVSLPNSSYNWKLYSWVNATKKVLFGMKIYDFCIKASPKTAFYVDRDRSDCTVTSQISWIVSFEAEQSQES